MSVEQMQHGDQLPRRRRVPSRYLLIGIVDAEAAFPHDQHDPVSDELLVRIDRSRKRSVERDRSCRVSRMDLPSCSGLEDLAVP